MATMSRSVVDKYYPFVRAVAKSMYDTASAIRRDRFYAGDGWKHYV